MSGDLSLSYLTPRPPLPYGRGGVASICSPSPVRERGLGGEVGLSSGLECNP